MWSPLCSLSTGDHDCAVLLYKFTGEKELDLISTYVPETFRGQGVAALLSQVSRTFQASVGFERLYLMCLMLLLQAAMDFLVEENLKAHISCWYIKKYIDDNPLQLYKELVITWLLCLVQPNATSNQPQPHVSYCTALRRSNGGCKT